jgi:LacI family transcriptional regulator
LEECRLPADPALSYLINEQEAPYIGLNHPVRANCDAIYVPGASLQAMEALHILTYVMKKEVPKEIALIGGENDRISSFPIPPLSTIEEPLAALAQRAVHHLCTLLNNDDTTSAGPIREILPVRLIRRVSGG